MRKHLVEIIQQRPGLNIEELAAEIGVFPNAIKHHVRQLVRHKLVVTEKQHRHVLHFDASMDPLLRRALSLLRIRAIRIVAQELLATEVVSWSNVAERLGISGRTLRRVVRRLEREGLAQVQRVRGSKAYIIDLHPKIRVLWARWVVPPTSPGLPELPSSGWMFAAMGAFLHFTTGANS